MSTTREIQIGDLVMLKSGSPNMVVIKLPKDPRGKLTAEYWNEDTKKSERVRAPVRAFEKPEEHIIRLQKLEEFRFSMQGPIIRMNETLLVIQFDTPEDKARFIQEKFQDEEEIPGKLN